MSEIAEFQRTPLYQEHVRAGAKLIEFGGWEMPVFYSSILEEHHAVREKVGVFDISHMGEFVVSGGEAAAFLNRMLTNNIKKLAVGQGQYSLLLNENGGVIDDLIVYRVGDDRYFLVVNAARIEEDFAWLERHLTGDVTLANESAAYAGLAVQGPDAVELLTKYLGISLPPRSGMSEVLVDGVDLLVGRTGYTGEDGAEIFFAAEEADGVWRKLLELGAKPCGLGARDTLRLEVCYPLNGSDLSPSRTPLAAGLGFFVDLEKDFIGRPALLAQKSTGLQEKLVPFLMTSKCPPPRSHYPVLAGDRIIGESSSGGLSPCLGQGIGMAYLPLEFAVPGTALEIDIRGKKYAAIVSKKPLYRKK